MADHIVGMFWNKNEGDIIEEIIINLLPHVDSLFIADDGSNDKSYEIINSLKSLHNKIEHVQQKPDKNDPGQRQSLLNEIRRRYKPENSWVQICESDIMILDTSVHDTIKHWARDGVLVDWTLLNAVRKPGTWEEVDTYPNWVGSIKDLMPYAHVMENMTYTFRPLPDVFYTKVWKPWPSGFSKHVKIAKVIQETPGIRGPLLAHYGWRGPKHTFSKFKSMGKFHKKYKDWNFESLESINSSVPFYNGTYNADSFPMSRKGYTERKDARRL